ncbi:MAG: hypothetical protein NVSMB62_18910 [Acidobacteriaceae bacterium]
MPTASETPAPTHAMYREIYEQPRALADTLARYIRNSELNQPAFGRTRDWLAASQNIIIAASGSSRHAGLAAEIMIEDLSGLPVDVEYSSEYATRLAYAEDNSALAVISQSGETADTLAALHNALPLGLQTLAITNVAASSMAHQALISLPTCAGVEKAIPATKSFTSQLLVVYLLALYAAHHQRRLDDAALHQRLSDLAALPDLIATQLPAWEQQTRTIAAALQHAQTFLYLGRGVHYAIAREGALKLKESSYLQAEGYPAGELKHGPNALVSPSAPLVVLATCDHADPGSILRYTKTLQLLRDMRAQGATILALVNAGDTEAAQLATHSIPISPTTEYLLPLTEVIPLQLFAYFIAIGRGIDVDHPRNLVKAVVTE